MASRYAIYTRSKKQADHTFSFSKSFPSLKMALEEKETNDRLFSNIETVIIESVDVGHEIDPYHKHFAKIA